MSCGASQLPVQFFIIGKAVDPAIIPLESVHNVLRFCVVVCGQTQTHSRTRITARTVTLILAANLWGKTVLDFGATGSNGVRGDGGDRLNFRTCKALIKSLPLTYHHWVFLQDGRPSYHSTNSVEALLSKKMARYPLQLIALGRPQCC